MKIHIFDVSHGFCASAIADNDNIMLIDCGHNEKTGFRPSRHLADHGSTGIEYLVIQNFDQDHVGDLANIVASRIPITLFLRNRSTSAQTLRALKEQSGLLTSEMQVALRMHSDFVHEIADPPVLQNIEFVTFCNEYPTFEDTNNLSLVCFLYYDGMGIVFPGDLETAGWEALLRLPDFREHLSRVNVFVASHHGRASGYCAAVFDSCSPDIIVISDKEIVHETQKHAYAVHASGVPWSGGPDMRYVLTTRSDGMITISKRPGDRYRVSVG